MHQGAEIDLLLRRGDRFFGIECKRKVMPAAQNSLEGVTQVAVIESLKLATRSCKTKASYGKGEHSFKLLAMIDPARMTAASPWAKRFIDHLKRKMDL